MPSTEPASIGGFFCGVHLAQENATQLGQSSTAGVGSIIGAVVLMAPRIMRGELDKLPPHHGPSHSSVTRSQKDLEELQRKLASDDGIGERIICDALHGITGFTRAATRDYLAVVKGAGAYARTIGEIAERIETE